MCYVRKQLDALYKYKNTGDEEKSLLPLLLWLEKRRFLIGKPRFSDWKTPFFGAKTAVFLFTRFYYLI